MFFSITHLIVLSAMVMHLMVLVEANKETTTQKLNQNRKSIQVTQDHVT